MIVILQTEMKSMKADFVFGFMQAMDGEKDPRILCLVFNTVPRVVREFPDFTRFSEVPTAILRYIKISTFI